MILALLNTIAKTDSTKEKENILKINSDNELLKNVYRLAYHKRIQFGIKKFPEAIADSEEHIALEDMLVFMEHVLATRRVTGNAAIALFTEYLGKLSDADREVTRRILARDLEVGASTSIANKVWKGLLPEQPQMLATSYSEKAISNIKYPAFAQLKADGARCFAEIRGSSLEDVLLSSRAGNSYLGLNKIKEELIKMTAELREQYPDGVCIDGELVYTVMANSQSGGTLDALFGEEIDQTKNVVLRTESNGIANKALKGTISPKEADNMSFQVWDVIPLDTIYGDLKSLEYSSRLDLLTSLCKPEFKRILLIETTLVKSLNEAREVYKKYVDQGLEGIILKNTNGQWEDKRSKNQVKFKEEITIDLKIVDAYPHKKDPNKLGGITLESACGRIRVNCGSGFTDTTQVKVKGKWVPVPLSDRDPLDREYLWTVKDKLIGTIAEIKCNGWVASEGRSDGVLSLFLPIIMKLREDKTQANTYDEVFA